MKRDRFKRKLNSPLVAFYSEKVEKNRTKKTAKNRTLPRPAKSFFFSYPNSSLHTNRFQVSELKRINNIHKDNEIFAHRSIKVPVQPFSILTETLNKIPDGEDKNCIYEVENPSTLKDEQILNLITTPIVVAPQRSEINNIILNSILEPLSTNETSENVEDAEDVQLLSPSEREITKNANLNDTFSCSGADWGLSWPQLLGVSLLLGLAGPIIYIFYIADASNHHSSSGH